MLVLPEPLNTLENIREKADNFHMALDISASLAEKERNLRNNLRFPRNQDKQNSPPTPFRYNKPNFCVGGYLPNYSAIEG